MRKTLIALLCLVASLSSCTAHAENSNSFDEKKIEAKFKADNTLRTGQKIDTLMDFSQVR